MGKIYRPKKYQKDLEIISPHPLEQIEDMEILRIKKTRRSKKNKTHLKYKSINEILNGKN